jgi:hypothetical protein
MLRNVFLVVLTLAMILVIGAVLTSKPSNKSVCEEVYCRLWPGMLESDLPALLGAPSTIVMGEPRQLHTAEGVRTIIYDTTQGTYQVKLYTSGEEQIAVAVSGGRVLAAEYRVSQQSVYYLGPSALAAVGGVGNVTPRSGRAVAIERRIATLLKVKPATPDAASPPSPLPNAADEAVRKKIAELESARLAVINDLEKQTGRPVPGEGAQWVSFNQWLNQVLEFEGYAMTDGVTAAGIVEKCKTVGLPSSYAEPWVKFIAARTAARQAATQYGVKELQDQVEMLATWREIRDGFRQNILTTRDQVAMSVRGLLQCSDDARFATFVTLDPNVKEKLLYLCVKASRERLADEDFRFLAGYAGLSAVLDAAVEAHKTAAASPADPVAAPAMDAARDARKTAATEARTARSERKCKPVRVWTSRGGHTVSARFVTKFGDTVKLQKEDGSIIAVDTAQLGDEDHQYLKSLER